MEPYNSSVFDWGNLMRNWNDIIFSYDKDKDYVLSTSSIAARWAGSLPATIEEISTLEMRLGLKLPDSYKSFLIFSNGWNYLSAQINKLYSAQQVTYLKYNNSYRYLELKKQYLISKNEKETSYKSIYLRNEDIDTLIQISEENDSWILMLNPKKTSNGEYEAILTSSSLGRIYTYTTFWHLMKKWFEYYRSTVDPSSMGKQINLLD